MKLNIKKGATVEVISGADKGKSGVVLGVQVNAKKKKIVAQVEGVAMKTNYDKQEGLSRKEGWIDYSNIKLVAAAAAKKTAKKKVAKKKAAKKA